MAYAEDVRVVGTLGKLNDAVQINYPTMATATFQLVGSPSMTVTFEANNDEGASPTFVPINALNVATGVSGTTATAAGIYRIEASGVRIIRVRCSAYSSGSFVVTANGSVAASADGVVTSGSVGGFTVAVNATFTRPANTTTYTASTGVANATSAAAQLTFGNAARFSGGSGVILGASLLDGANQTLKGQFELWLFDTTIGTIIADNANWTPANADLANLVGIIPFNTSYVGNNGSGASGNVIYESGLINFPFKCNGSANLFGMLVVRNAYVPVSAETFICRLLVSCD